MGFLGRILGNMEEEPPPIGQAPSGGGSFKVEAVYKIMGLGIVAVGQVTEGRLAVGLKTFVNGKRVVIRSMEAGHKQLSFASAGQSIGMNLKGISKEDIRPGTILNF